MNLGSEIRVCQGFETHLKRPRDLAGSRESISGMSSSGRFTPVSIAIVLIQRLRENFNGFCLYALFSGLPCV